jgi:hypothetical protein
VVAVVLDNAGARLFEHTLNQADAPLHALLEAVDSAAHTLARASDRLLRVADHRPSDGQHARLQLGTAGA